ncbi:MAG: TetR/AcrR family transcriptional regulator [Anaerolineaceae bacterium]|nr:TetR/AcrR family transcriptional regulator [Anaerolineaceae bacterium]
MKDLKQIQENAAKQAIIDIARKIILQVGVSGLSMRGLAKQVGCSPATLYKYFENKKDILEAIRAEGWHLMGQIQREFDLDNLAPSEKLLALSSAFQKFPTAYPEHYMLMFGSMDAENFTVESHLKDPGFQGLVQLIQSAVNDGDIQTNDFTADQLAYHIWFLSHGIAMLRITLFREDPDFSKVSDDILQSFAKSILKK